MQSENLSTKNLNWLYAQLHRAYGELGWWPANSRFEIVIGAVLVQNTAWTNVEKAIANLAAQQWLQPDALLNAPADVLLDSLRPAGTFRVKAQRLRKLCQWWLAQGGFVVLDQRATTTLRKGLLNVHGVGPETADAILLYALQRPVFVIDAYTRRLLARLGWLETEPGYEALRAVFERTLPQDAKRFGQYHALIVEHAKRHCRARPVCKPCPLVNRCNYGNANVKPESA